jgi:hypothetical protein
MLPIYVSPFSALPRVSYQPILQWLEEIGRIMTKEEEEEVDSRFKKSARSKLMRPPRFVTPDQVQTQLAGSKTFAYAEKWGSAAR